MDDWWDVILTFLPARDGLYVNKEWYCRLLERARREHRLYTFLSQWVARYKMKSYFMKRIMYDVPYRLQYFYIHQNPTQHICSVKLPYFVKHITLPDIVQKYFAEIDQNHWERALETVVFI